jgi:phosphoribosylformimino-5-aminoimidazole carboxamide ribotide isomerase
MAELDIRPVPLKEVWRMRHEIMYPDKTIEFVQLEDDNNGIHHGLFETDELVSVVSLFADGDKLQFRKFATLTAKQGRGYGFRLLAYVMDWVFKNGYRYIWCNARVSAIGFYQKFGMSATGDSWKKWDIDFIKMEKYLMHADHSGN